MWAIVALVLVIFSVTGFNADTDTSSGRAVQILRPENHLLNFELNDLKQILECDEIRDRDIAVISIAGAFRKGKSFLLNFFIRYLDAEVAQFQNF